MFQITPGFAVPFAEAQWAEGPARNPELKALFLARAAEGDRWRNPAPSMRLNPKLYESDFNVFAWTEPCVLALREFCWGALSRLIAQLNGYGAEEMNRLQIHSHTWFHVTRTGGYFGLHNHPMASWSGVYCVTPGEEDAEHPDSGALHFSNPNQLANMFVDPANARVRAPYGMAGKSFRLRAGQLVLFPSWVNHEVLPYTAAGERITLAFNCWFSWQGEVP
jgi:hypothetical protein